MVGPTQKYPQRRELSIQIAVRQQKCALLAIFYSGGARDEVAGRESKWTFESSGYCRGAGNAFSILIAFQISDRHLDAHTLIEDLVAPCGYVFVESYKS